MAEEQKRFDIHLYEWQFIEPEIALQYMCNVCKKILKKPVTTRCCEAQYCKSCVEDDDDPECIYALQCAVCEEWSTAFQDEKKWENVLELLVKCPFGCSWKGCIKDSSQHLATDCIFIGKKDGSDNKESKKNQSATFAYQNVSLNCPGCHKKLLQNCKEHIEGCPELEISCEYESVGCKFTPKRKLLANHQAENLQEHSRLLSLSVHSKIKQSILLSQEYTQESEENFARYVEQAKDALTNHQQMLKTIQQKTQAEQYQVQQNLSQLCTRTKYTIKEVLKYKPYSLWELDRNSVQQLTKIHSGQFCEVWKGMQYEAIKIAIKYHKPDSATSQTFLQEALVLKQLEHDNILKLYGVCTRDDPFMIITEYMTHGSLLEFLKNRGEFLANSMKLDILHQITNGMAYLESLNWIHGALKSCNILVGDELKCKLSGFKLAQKLSSSEREYKIPGGIRTQVKWSAPEVLTRRICSTKSDVWSFGIIIWEVLIGKKLKIRKLDVEGVIKHSDCMLLFTVVPDDPKLCQMMTQCLKKDPEERPLFRDIMITLTCIPCTEYCT